MAIHMGTILPDYHFYLRIFANIKKLHIALTGSDIMPSIAVIIPCYKSAEHVLHVLGNIPNIVDVIYCIDDACPDRIGQRIEKESNDKRIHVLYHKKNQGVGGAMITGYRAALKKHADIIIKIDSDGQMDPALIPLFIQPIIDGRADYTKGNRFYTPEFLSSMPGIRILGNAGLSFLTKFSTGYWQIFDPTNGYTAIHAHVLRLLPLDKISKNYFFETDILFRLGTVRAVVMDIPQKAVYGDEKSNLNIPKTLLTFSGAHLRNFLKRIIYNYFIRDFHVASLEWVLGPALLIFSIMFGAHAWIDSVQSEVTATPGIVMLAALPFVAGLQLTLSADIQSQSKTPLHKLIRACND